MGHSPQGSKESDTTEQLHFLSLFMGGRGWQQGQCGGEEQFPSLRTHAQGKNGSFDKDIPLRD